MWASVAGGPAAPWCAAPADGPGPQGSVSSNTAATRSRNRPTEEEVLMSRSAGARYECEECGAVLVYEKPCPCTSENEHSEVCCDKPMKQLVQAN